MADLNIDNQYDFFKEVRLDENGALIVSLEEGGGFSYLSDNYTELSSITGMMDGQIAYVENSEGTKWLPSSLGGTFYPSGIYLYNGSSWVSDRNDIALTINDVLKNRIVCRQDNISTTLGAVIDSSKEYFIDGIIDLGSTQITVPSTGMTIKGYSFDLSGLTSSEDNYSMFVDSGGAGNLLMIDLYLSATGTNSEVYNLTDVTGFNAIELNRVNFIDCESLGTLNGYRQGLEVGTGRFGGKPSLTFSGTWLGGYFIDTSIVRSLDNASYYLFTEGTSFSMNSRFRSNMNVDLPALAGFLDFQNSNFVNPSTLQLTNMIISRNGVFDATDSNYTPNIDQTDLSSAWSGNNGLPNTFEGGRLKVSSENLTNILAGSTWYDLNAIWTSNRLEHFDSPSAGQLRHIGESPREFRCVVNFVIEGGNNNDLSIRLRKWDDSSSSFIEISEVRRQVNNLVGGRDVAIFNSVLNVNLDKNDYVYWQIKNNSGNQNATLELDSDWFLEER